MASTDPIFAGTGRPINHFSYRSFARARVGELGGPQLRAIRVNGRVAVLFSTLDVSAALVGEHIDGIVGYEPETAVAIARSILLNAIQR
jgi:hypothetical protein